MQRDALTTPLTAAPEPAAQEVLHARDGCSPPGTKFPRNKCCGHRAASIKTAANRARRQRRRPTEAGVARA
eukprot:10320796-Lingulodinium_polyedra.AAC.1